jgi:hypothetical protein
MAKYSKGAGDKVERAMKRKKAHSRAAAAAKKAAKKR